MASLRPLRWSVRSSCSRQYPFIPLNPARGYSQRLLETEAHKSANAESKVQLPKAEVKAETKAKAAIKTEAKAESKNHLPKAEHKVEQKASSSKVENKPKTTVKTELKSESSESSAQAQKPKYSKKPESKLMHSGSQIGSALSPGLITGTPIPPSNSKLPPFNPTMGILYRGRTTLSLHPDTSNTVRIDPKNRGPILPNFSTLDYESIKPKDINPPENMPSVPLLNHGLRSVLFSRGVHPLQNPTTSKIQFDPFLQQIHHPTEIDFARITPFIPPSNDKTLHKLAVNNGCKFKGSTSSLSPILGQLYFALSRFKPVNLSCLSRRFQDEPKTHTRAAAKPKVFILRPLEGTYSIDNDSGLGVPRNQILMDLGKSMECMLTMEPDAFAKRLLKSRTHEVKTEDLNLQDAFNFMKVNDIIARSQLDCYDPDLPSDKKIFDLKTRATNAIRLNIENYETYLGYKLTSMTGFTHSYEREFYDMARSAFMKYGFQIRMGRMAGIFIAYHNTSEIFGFEFVSGDEIDRCVYGSNHLADKVFNITFSLLSKVLNRVTKDNPDQTLRIIISSPTKPEKGLSTQTDIFVQRVTNDLGWIEKNSEGQAVPEKKAVPLPPKPGDISRYVLRLATSVNNGLVFSGHLPDFSPTDKFDVFYQLNKDESSPIKIFDEYQKVMAWVQKYQD